MKKNFYHSLIMLGIITLTFAACKKDKQNTDDVTDIASVEENAQGDETFSDVFTRVSNFSTEYDASFTASAELSPKSIAPFAVTDGPVVTILPQGNMWPKTVTFDFGAGITKDLVTRKGKIVAVYSNRFKTTGATVTITFDNYYVNDTKIEGTKTIINNGKNALGNYTFSTAVAKSKINDKRGTFTYDANRTIEWLKGENTPLNILDDEFAITGSSVGTNSKGITFTTNITSPLIKKIGHPYLVAGVIEIKPGDRAIRTLNYGNGELDAKATLTVNGVTWDIWLRK